ncbi:hypothetical protein B0H11DRAFT_2232927, partial [Mycena galericulata]
MDTTAVRRFMASNVVWPLDKFFIPAGGLTGFLRENLRFKIFLIMTSIFTDPFAGVTVSSLTQLEMNQVRARMRDVVSHVFFAAQIRQNEFRVAYSPIGVPAQAAWMFHMILTLLHIVGFEGDDITVVTNEVAEARMTEGQLAYEQVSSLLGGALATYVEETKLGIPAILDYKEYDPSAHIPVQEHRLDAYELSEMVSGWKGPIDFEIHSKDLPSSIDAVVAAEQVLNLGLPGTLDAVNNVNLQGFPYEDLRIRRARSVRAWNIPGGVADRRTKKERQSPAASSRTSKSSLKVLRLAEDFDFRFGRPSTGFSPHLRGHYTSRIRSCIEIAVKGQRPNDMDDVPLQPQVACLPYVPSWNLEQIRSLQLQERSDPYAGENARMFEEIEFADNLS